MVYVTAVHMEGGTQHQHIASVRWRDPSDNQTGQSTRAAMVEWISNGGQACVNGADGRTAQVGVVNASPAYIRAYADGDWNDNLLALPRF
jgi:hypothetical protein